MKLLAKQQLQDDLSLQKKMEIDQGVVIARKVDVLRETYATLEKQYNDFMVHSKEERNRILGELDYDINEKNKLLKGLDEQRKLLLKPLDDEWAKLKEEQKEHTLNIEGLSLKQNELSKKEEGIKKEEERLGKEGGTIKDIQLSTAHDRDRAVEARRKGEQVLEEANRFLVKTKEDLSESERVLSLKEKDNNTWASALDRREKLLQIKEQQLSDKERFVNDKYQTMLRTQQRLNGKRTT